MTEVTMVGAIVKVKANGKKYSNRKLQVTPEGQLFVVYHGITLPVVPKEDDITTYVLADGIEAVSFKASENPTLIEAKAKAEEEAKAKKAAQEKAKAEAKAKKEAEAKKAEEKAKKEAEKKAKANDDKKTA